MAYSSLWLQSYRSYTDYSVELTDGVNIVVGPNGSGKTNLLEALYVLSGGSSFRAKDRDVIQHGKPWLRIEALYEDHKRIATFELSEERLKKNFTIDGVSKQRLTHKTKLPVVLFEPDDLRLLTESPSERREYFDRQIAQLSPLDARHQTTYVRVLLQRNNLLKRGHELSRAALQDQLFVWDIKLAELAAAVVAARRQLLAQINEHLGELYSRIASREHQVKAVYETALDVENYQSALLAQLHARLSEDVARGFTSVGPHRDDMRFLLDGVDSASSASRGETRTLLLSLKMIELDLLEVQADHPPLLLLDDVFSELDAARRRMLAELASTYQTIITTTDADAIVKHFLTGYHVIATDQPLD